MDSQTVDQRRAAVQERRKEPDRGDDGPGQVAQASGRARADQGAPHQREIARAALHIESRTVKNGAGAAPGDDFNVQIGSPNLHIGAGNQHRAAGIASSRAGNLSMRAFKQTGLLIG